MSRIYCRYESDWETKIVSDCQFVTEGRIHTENWNVKRKHEKLVIEIRMEEVVYSWSWEFFLLPHCEVLIKLNWCSLNIQKCNISWVHTTEESDSHFSLIIKHDTAKKWENEILMKKYFSDIRNHQSFKQCIYNFSPQISIIHFSSFISHATEW